jgi:molybdenum cofactor biosynthesis enzyme MoaA/ribosomal protein S18 acetylase RimI-like enzyme
MSWRIIRTETLAEIKVLYEQVFEVPLDVAVFNRKKHGRQIHMFIVKKANLEQPVGFVIFIGRGQTAEMWMAGIIPSKRHQGGGTFLIEQGEKEMLRKGYSTVRVNTYNHWNIMLSILTRRGYRIVETTYNDSRSDFKITLQREIETKRELRYALTEKCNFNCLFCHNEGLGGGERKHLEDGHILETLKASIAAGYTDITFTGGEPTLKINRLLYLIGQLGTLTAPPDITLVTNGSRLNDAIIKTLVDYPGRKKIHLSMHAVDEQSFQEITGRHQPGLFTKIKRNICRAANSGLKIKMNHVVLRNLNHNKAVDAIQLARSMGVTTIKFIELLVLPEHPEIYARYYDINALKAQLLEILGPAIVKNARQQIYPHCGDARFKIELQRCTCALGCAHCRENRDRTYSSDLCYHPCFVRSRKYFRIEDPSSVENILKTGNRIIDGFAARYKDKSPTLIQKEVYIRDKTEYFYKLDDIDAFRSFLADNGFGVKAKSGFHEEYYRPEKPSSVWKSFHRVLKIGWFYHDTSRVSLIYTDQEYHHNPALGLRTTVRFLDPEGPFIFDTPELARHLLDRLEFECFLQLEWDLETWEKGAEMINLATSGGKITAKINGPEKMAVSLFNKIRAYGYLT